MVTVLSKQSKFKAMKDGRLCNMSWNDTRLWPHLRKIIKHQKFTAFKWIGHWTELQYMRRTNNDHQIYSKYTNEMLSTRLNWSVSFLQNTPNSQSNQKRNIGTTLRLLKISHLHSINHWIFKHLPWLDPYYPFTDWNWCFAINFHFTVECIELWTKLQANGLGEWRIIQYILFYNDCWWWCKAV